MLKIVTRLAFCTGLALIMAAGQQASAAGQAVSKGVAKQLQAAQKASQEKKYAECISQAQAASNVAGRSAYDDFIINRLLGYCYVRTGNYGAAFGPLKAALDSGMLPADDVPTQMRGLAQIAYTQKNYDAAIELGNRAIKQGYGNDDMYTIVAQAMYLKGDNKGAQNFLNNLIAAQERGGGVPKEQTLLLVQSACVKLKDNACITSSFEKLVDHYPKEEYWKNLLATLMNSGANDKTMLHIYRLASEVNAMNGPTYLEMAQLAIEAGLPGEAQSAMETATARNAITDPREVASGQRLLASAKTAAAADRATLAKQDADAAKKPTGEADYKVGVAELSYGQYPQAVAAISRGIAKGSIKNLGEAQLMLGIAQYRAGNKADAIKSFKAVKGDPTLERLASLWALRAK